MNNKYDHKKIEKKWQKVWEKQKLFEVKDSVKGKKNLYILDMFPYPSGAGLHVGHPEGYTATDILTRYKRANGYNVLHPMGWDAFGLPAENYAIKNGIHPEKSTKQNIKRFTEQIKSIGLSYDWSRELSSADPEYYKWTQWLFLQFYKKGLAYKKEANVNWCPKDNTVLANEQVVNGKCERCGTEVVQKMLAQWFFKITKYADSLLKDVEGLDWPEPIKLMQKNWIGRSEGAEIEFQIPGSKFKVPIFTTRPDTIFGATYLVIAPEHGIISNLKVQISNWNEVQKYINSAKKKSELQRTDLNKDKSGVELKGIKAINPATKQEVPIWVADYVLGAYGTGAIMAVPAHDERDFEFAKKFNLPIKRVVQPMSVIVSKVLVSTNKKRYDSTQKLDDKLSNIENLKEPYTRLSGKIINSGIFNGIDCESARVKMAKEYGKLKVQYKLRDWLISRQRYWGAPIPIIYCDKCGEQPVPEKDLPVKLPHDVDFRPTGESPLMRSASFHKVECPKCGATAKRDSDTMDTFVDSSWYFLRFADPKNKKEFASKKSITSWLPVNVYVGGAEHAVLHLLYARFFTKVLKDLGYVNFSEPFLKLRNQGLILGPDGEKMSKSKGNVVNPDDVVNELGADSLRLYEMFMGPLEDAKPWSTQSIVGVRRFLERVWGLAGKISTEGGSATGGKNSETTERALNKLVKKVTEDIEAFRFNTCISSMMEFLNIVKDEQVSPKTMKVFLTLLHPFAPHIAEELYQAISHRPGSGSSSGKKSIQLEPWPKFDPKKIVDESIEIIVQVNGKIKEKLLLAPGSSQQEVEKAVKSSVKLKGLSLENAKRVIFVPDRIINFVM